MQTLIVSFLRVAAAFEIMFHLGFNRHNTRHTWRSNQVHVVFSELSLNLLHAEVTHYVSLGFLIIYT